MLAAASLALAPLALAGCGGEAEPPERLLDGSPPLPPPVRLEGVTGPVVLTKARALRPADGSPRLEACAAEHGTDPVAAVERVGVGWESVTLRDRSGRWLFACDDTAGPRVEGRRWCGGAAGRLVGGVLRDPRLDVLCRDEGGERVAFAWLQPGAGTAYVAVRRGDVVEAYEPAAGLPVRVYTAEGVREDPLGAAFAVSEHDAGGRLLREYRLEAVPAG
ncbi:MAG TPA: hypothetical protein VNJ46_04350 [Gaiellaceae bacterium]|nr:hypothetical protein [Gaiellaceae bacterium]